MLHFKVVFSYSECWPGHLLAPLTCCCCALCRFVLHLNGTGLGELICIPPNLSFRILIHAVGLGSWMLLIAKAAFTSCVAMVALQMYLGIPSQLANSHY